MFHIHYTGFIPGVAPRATNKIAPDGADLRDFPSFCFIEMRRKYAPDGADLTWFPLILFIGMCRKYAPDGADLHDFPSFCFIGMRRKYAPDGADLHIFFPCFDILFPVPEIIHDSGK